MFYYSIQLPICTVSYVLEWPIFVLPLGLSWMGLSCTILQLLSHFYLFISQLSSLCHLGELSFIWTYLCGNKVGHNHLLLTFCIFCTWALTPIWLIVPSCQRLHIRIYFIVLSSYLGSRYSSSLALSRLTVQNLCCSFISLHSFLPLDLFSKPVKFLISSLKPK